MLIDTDMDGEAGTINITAEANLTTSDYYGYSYEDGYNGSLLYEGDYIDYKLYQSYQYNMAVPAVAYYSLIFAYVVLIVIGSIGNLLVLGVIVFNKRMRTARNTFIATLAVADTTQCLFSMPMTLMGIITKYWPFGPNSWVLCKVVRTSPAVTVFFSSFMMALIAVDRHRYIVHSEKRQVSVLEAVLISIAMFLLAVIFSTPFTIFTRLRIVFDEPGAFDHISFCLEDMAPLWTVLISVSVIVVQYIVPCSIIIISYTLVYRYLKTRPVMAVASDARARRLEKQRLKTNRMLILVAVTHFISWLPLNLFNIIMYMFDSNESPLFPSTESTLITYAVCHLASMSSACTNPILYGYLNESFRAEFAKIFQHIKATACKNGNNNNSNNNGNAGTVAIGMTDANHVTIQATPNHENAAEAAGSPSSPEAVVSAEVNQKLIDVRCNKVDKATNV